MGGSVHVEVVRLSTWLTQRPPSHERTLGIQAFVEYQCVNTSLAAKAPATAEGTCDEHGLPGPREMGCQRWSPRGGGGGRALLEGEGGPSGQSQSGCRAVTGDVKAVGGGGFWRLEMRLGYGNAFRVESAQGGGGRGEGGNPPPFKRFPGGGGVAGRAAEPAGACGSGGGGHPSGDGLTAGTHCRSIRRPNNGTNNAERRVLALRRASCHPVFAISDGVLRYCGGADR